MKRAAWVVALVVASSCKDEGAEQHRRAMDAYGACVAKGAVPGDSCFEAVRAQLAKVPDPKAQALAESLRPRPALGAPLAVDGPCRALAEALGTTPDAGRHALRLQLDACRKAAHEDGGHDERP